MRVFCCSEINFLLVAFKPLLCVSIMSIKAKHPVYLQTTEDFPAPFPHALRISAQEVKRKQCRFQWDQGSHFGNRDIIQGGLTSWKTQQGTLLVLTVSLWRRLDWSQRCHFFIRSLLSTAMVVFWGQKVEDWTVVGRTLEKNNDNEQITGHVTTPGMCGNVEPSSLVGTRYLLLQWKLWQSTWWSL